MGGCHPECGVRHLGSLFPKILVLREGLFGSVGSWVPQTRKRCPVTRPARIVPDDVTGVRTGQWGIVLGLLGPGEPSLFSPTLPPYPSLQWARVVCIVEDDGGRHVFHSVTAS